MMPVRGGFVCLALLGCLAGSLTAMPSGRVQGVKDLVNKRFTGNVVSVIDGDTVDVLIPPGRKERVRLHGMDAPESGEPFSTVARNFLRVMIFSRDVTVTGTDVDRYGRLVARIVVDGQDASERTIAAGLACTFHQYAKEPVLDAAMARARSARLGFWAQPGQMPACVARETLAGPMPLLSASVSGFIGNVSSKVYHSPTCRNATCKNCTRKFASRQEAEAAGFRAAGDCLAR